MANIEKSGTFPHSGSRSPLPLALGTLKKLLPREVFDNARDGIFLKSLSNAALEQGIQSLMDQLSALVPDLSAQYTNTRIEDDFFRVKLRALHAFQVSLCLEAIERIGNRKSLTLVDIGDSAGTHSTYLKGVVEGRKLSLVSANLDPVAVAKIKSKGLTAIQCRAEELTEKHGIRADIGASFEMLEHLPNPAAFLHSLASAKACKLLVLTVPYLRASRVGMHHIRRNDGAPVNAEDVHYFELSPDDWKLLFRHAGWETVVERIHWQYPRKSVAAPVLRQLWCRRDYEGFYGVILSPNSTWSDRYSSW